MFAAPRGSFIMQNMRLRRKNCYLRHSLPILHAPPKKGKLMFKVTFEGGLL